MRNLIVLCLLTAIWSCSAPQSPKTSANNSNLDSEIEKKVSDLLAKMTIKEKLGQMVQYNGPFDLTGPPPTDDYAGSRYEKLKTGDLGSMLNITGAANVRAAQQLSVDSSRLGIPLIIGYDVIHGYQTMFPVPLGESATWSEDAVKLSAKVAAAEAGSAGINWTFAPMIDISRDARWGRVMEGAGEDPYLGSVLAAARVKGFQGDDYASPNTIAACAKHFAGYGFAESGKDYNTVDVSENTLRNVILPPFKAAADAGALTFMNSFNDLNGVPATGNEYLQRDILKGEWDWNGFVISDWGSIVEMIPHGYAEDKKHAAEIAFNAGSDMDMESNAYDAHGAELLEEGKVNIEQIDEAVRRILRVKHQLGLFDDPYKYCDLENEKAMLGKKEHLEAAKAVAQQSIVLLKNEENILPLNKAGQSIAVIGPFGNDKDTHLGNWRARAIPNSSVSVLEGVQAKVATGTKVSFAEGIKYSTGERTFLKEMTINNTDRTGITEAARVARAHDVVLLVVGEDCFQSGEGRSQADVSLAGLQNELIDAVYKANKNVVMLLTNGRPIDISEVEGKAKAIVETWQLGSEAGSAIADVVFGDYNPQGKLPVSFPRSTGQMPLYYNHKVTGRPTAGPDFVTYSHYTDESNDPLYPFGFGLNYSEIAYSNIKISSASVAKGSTVKVSVDVTNKGNKYGATETVQLYIQDVTASWARPIKELKGFQKVDLKPGATQTVTFELGDAELGFYTKNDKFEVEAGKFNVYLGGNSRDVLTTSFEVK